MSDDFVTKGLRLSQAEAEQMEEAAERVGLNFSALARIGLRRVLCEIEATGTVTAGTPVGEVES